MQPRRIAAAALLIALALGGRAAAAPAERPLRSIALVLNGDVVDTDTPPRVIGGRVLLPLRPVFEGLGISVTRVGPAITAQLPNGALNLTVGSTAVNVAGRKVTLDSPVLELDGATYVPLKFLSAALGATATYDQRGGKVTVISGMIGRTAGLEGRAPGGGVTYNGIVSAIDANSLPTAITIVQGAQSRTININSDAKIFIEDVSVHSQVKGELGDLRVGDHLTAVLARDGRVAELHDIYSSDNGTISAVSPIAVVLQNGRVIQPGKTTEITLNGAAAKITDLALGDAVTVRKNPESGEIRQLLASRTVAATATPQPVSGNAKIASFTLNATRPLRAGESFDVTLVGTPGGQATFDIGDYLSGLPMKEDSAGSYSGRYTIPERFNVSQVPVYGRLSAGGSQSPRVAAATLLSAATSAPQIAEVAPANGATVNNPRPSIYATFVTPTQVPISTSSISISVNGHDVTAAATRSGQFVNYMPGVDYPDGQVLVVVKVSDAAGNTASRSWSFAIKSR